MSKPAPNVVVELELDLWMKQAAALRDAGEVGKAVQLYQKVLARRPGHAAAMREMGTAAFDTGAFDVAEAILEQAAKAAPKSAITLLELGRTQAARNRPQDAIRTYQRAMALAPNEPAIFTALGEAQIDTGDKEAARKSLKRALKLRPGHELSAHLLAALEGGTAAPTNAYTAALFDHYAGTFDSHLVQTLAYETPTLMRTIADAVAPARTFAAALELGCGTGLVGEAFAGKVGAIDGIDISAGMIEAAKAKNRYRHLEVAEIADFLARPAVAGAYDLVIAADVFVYVGRLEAVFAGVARALRPDGLFVFSVEDIAEGEAEIRSSGRYAHSAAYIARLAREHGFTIRDERTADLRKERGAAIAGRLFALANA